MAATLDAAGRLVDDQTGEVYASNFANLDEPSQMQVLGGLDAQGIAINLQQPPAEGDAYLPGATAPALPPIEMQSVPIGGPPEQMPSQPRRPMMPQPAGALALQPVTAQQILAMQGAADIMAQSQTPMPKVSRMARIAHALGGIGTALSGNDWTAAASSAYLEQMQQRQLARQQRQQQSKLIFDTMMTQLGGRDGERRPLLQDYIDAGGEAGTGMSYFEYQQRMRGLQGGIADINPVTGGMAAQKPIARETQEKMKGLLLLMRGLRNVGQMAGANPELFTFVKQYGADVRAFLEKAGREPNEQERKLISDWTALRGYVGRLFDVYRVSVTGAAAGQKEMADMMQNFINRRQSYTEFKSMLDILERTAREEYDMQYAINTLGFMEDPDEFLRLTARDKPGRPPTTAARSATTAQRTPPSQSSAQGMTSRQRVNQEADAYKERLIYEKNMDPEQAEAETVKWLKAQGML